MDLGEHFRSFAWCELKASVNSNFSCSVMLAFAAAVQPPAGKATTTLNSSFSALDYHTAKLESGRSFLMDDYLQSGRVTRRANVGEMQHLNHDNARELLQYQTDTTLWQPKQGFSETKFHRGFMRRQGSSMQYLQERVHEGIPYLQEQKGEPPVVKSGRRAPAPDGPRDVITGMGVTKNLHHGERRHTEDHHERYQAMHADAPGGRLRDSTARFFCTPDQLPHRPARKELLASDGLFVTKRTSTVIGVGINPSQEIFSVGAREALNDSLYGLQRRAQFSKASGAADAALVRALPS